MSGVPARYVYGESSYGGQYVFLQLSEFGDHHSRMFVGVQAWVDPSATQGAAPTGPSDAKKAWVPLVPWHKERSVTGGLDLFPALELAPGSDGVLTAQASVPEELQNLSHEYLHPSVSVAETRKAFGNTSK